MRRMPVRVLVLLLLTLGAAPAAASQTIRGFDPARDARTLQEGGYRLEKLLPIDQFLWSAHVELIALFARAPISSRRQ